jgi:hypothetical protein
MWEAMTACVIMRNMIIEEEHDNNLFDQGRQYQRENVATESGPPTYLVDLQDAQHEMRDKATHLRC